MRIGNLTVDTTALLAPMAAVTDLPFRTVCEEHGAGLTITEFLSAHALLANDEKTHGKMTASLGGRPFGVQIFGRQIAPMIEGARMAVDAGAALVDINMGCPAKRVVAGECGSALMREPELAQEIVRAVRSAVPAAIPVTVKHRAGWDAMHRNAPEFACAMVEAGAAMITVHGRTRTQGFGGMCDLEIIRRVRDAVPSEIPVVGNGDVACPTSYRRMREETGCDAVMIGRGAWGNPWLFSRIRALEAGLADPGPPALEDRQQVFHRHVELIAELKAGPRLIHEVRKACVWYTKGLHACNALRQRVWKIDASEEAIREVDGFFAAIVAHRDTRGESGAPDPNHDGDQVAA